MSTKSGRKSSDRRREYAGGALFFVVLTTAFPRLLRRRLRRARSADWRMVLRFVAFRIAAAMAMKTFAYVWVAGRELEQRLGRSPSRTELREHLRVSI